MSGETENRGLLATAAFVGMLGVILGAVGAHRLEDFLRGNEGVETWDTAVFYHLVHAVALLLPTMQRCRGAWWAYLAGVFFFSGSLYSLSLTNISDFGASAAVGGVLLIGGVGLAGCFGLPTRALNE